MEGEVGINLLDSIDFSMLQQALLSVIAAVLAKTNFLFEDKLVIENALNLWIGCILYKPDLFDGFLSYKSGE